MQRWWGALAAAVILFVAIIVIVIAVRARKKPRRVLPPVVKRGMAREIHEPKKLSRAAIVQRYAAGERDFTGLTVGGTELDGNMVLDGADFSEAQWVRTNVQGSFQNTKLRSAKLFQVSFLDADFSGADFSGAMIKGGDFDRSKMKGATFHGAYIVEPTWGSCDLSGADFGQAFILAGDFRHLKLDAINFKGALYTKNVVWPSGFSTEKAGLQFLDEGADLHDFDFSHRAIGGDDAVKFKRANLRNAKFIGSDLVDIDFYGADLRGADFSGANIQHASFLGANLEGTIFKDAVGSTFENTGGNDGTKTTVDLEARGAIMIHVKADLRGVDFTGMTFYRPTVFEQCDLRGARFEGAQLKDVSFFYSNLDGAVFDRADMYRTSFACCDTTNVSVTNVRHAPGIERLPGQKMKCSYKGKEIPY